MDKLKTYKTRISKIKSIIDKYHGESGLLGRYITYTYNSPASYMVLEKGIIRMAIIVKVRMDYKLIIKEENNCIFFCIDLNQPKYILYDMENLGWDIYRGIFGTSYGNNVENTEMLKEISKNNSSGKLYTKNEVYEDMSIIENSSLYGDVSDVIYDITNNADVSFKRDPKTFKNLSDLHLLPIITLELDSMEALYHVSSRKNNIRVPINNISVDNIRSALCGTKVCDYCEGKIIHKNIKGGESILEQ